MMRIAAVFCLSLALAAPASAKKNTTAKPDEGLTAVMAGEFALQAGRLPEATQWYLRAAQAESGDAGLAERATRIALLAGDDDSAAQALKLWQQRGKRTEVMRGAEATLALRQGDLAAAKRELTALLREPDDLGWRFALAALTSGQRKPEVVAKTIGELLDANALPGKLPAWIGFGSLAQRLDQKDLAERIVGEAVKRFPDEPRIALLHASQLRQIGKPDEAAKLLATLEPASLLVPELRSGIAYEYDAMGQPVAAAQAMARGPQDNRTYGTRASLLAKAKDQAALVGLYDELRKQAASPDPQRLLLLGEIAQFLERPQEALDWYQRVPGGQERVEARLRIANSLYELGRKDEAFAAARKMQADAAIDDTARRAAYLLEAELRQKDKDDAGEFDALARGLAAWPDDNAILYARALAWERRDRIDHAEADLRRILVTEPENTAALNALGYTLADRTNRYQEALELIDRARAAEPDDAAIIDSFGWVLYRLGRTDEALMQLRRAYTMQKDPEIAAHLGEVLWMQGQKDEARKYFDESRRLDPENRSLLRALQKTGA